MLFRLGYDICSFDLPTNTSALNVMGCIVLIVFYSFIEFGVFRLVRSGYSLSAKCHKRLRA